MSECICNYCRNLKAQMDDNGAVIDFDCSYGFPSVRCEECDGEGCELTCEHFVEDMEEETLVTVNCASCGKELTQSGSDNTEGKVYCIDCFLKQ